MKLNRICLVLLFVAAFSSATVPVANAQVVEKAADLVFGNADGVGSGGYAPLDRFVQVGTNLWFTTSKGGAFDAGTISRFDLVTREVVQVASMDNDTGKAPEAAILVVGGEGFFTTANGGNANKGTIAKINLTNGIVTTVYNFPTNVPGGNPPSGATPRAGLTRIGDELWTTTSLGGTANRGTMVKFNLTSGITTVVTNFDGPIVGGQPYESLTTVGDAHYFTTFTGGSTFATTGLPLGAGTLSRLTFDTNNNPLITRLIDLPGGYTQFPAQAPVAVGTNSLYFMTVGPTTNPGAIIRYDISTGFWTNLFSFRTNTADQLAYGKQTGYNGLIEWQGDLYFVTRQGGISNNGVVAKFNIVSNTVTKLADLEGTTGLALGSESGGYNTGLVVEDGNRFYAYFPISAGGANNRGTILRVSLPPPPIQATLASTNVGEFTLSWTGGYAPFTVQGREEVQGGTWTNVVSNITNRSITLPAIGERSFLRVGGGQ